jgi:prepilin-type N-terminal cleavage/methylation domain-containing protein
MHNRNGFTIVELLIVIVVIAILAAITIVAFNGVVARAQDADRLSDINLTKKAIAMYRADNSGLVPLCGGGNGASCTLASITSQLSPAYTSSIPNDPVASYPYQYVGYNPASGDSQWSIRVYMNNTPNTYCKAGENMLASWWSSAPACHS